MESCQVSYISKKAAEILELARLEHDLPKSEFAKFLGVDPKRYGEFILNEKASYEFIEEMLRGIGVMLVMGFRTDENKAGTALKRLKRYAVRNRIDMRRRAVADGGKFGKLDEDRKNRPRIKNGFEGW